MKLAIKGHPTRGKEVIEILEMLGGINELDLKGIEADSHYYVGSIINRIYRGLGLNPQNCIGYTLEEFLEKFPYKVGDKVQYKGATSCGSIFEVEEMRWEENTVKYTLCLFGCNYKRSTLPAKYLQPYEEETMEEKEPEPKAPILSNRYDYAEGKCGYVIPNGYEFDSIKQGFQTEIILRPIKPQYPKTYEECCEVIGINRYDIEIDLPQTYQQKMFNLFKLHICRDAYWKIAGEQMGLDGSWEPDYITEDNQLVYIITTQRGYLSKNTSRHWNYILAFPTKEMRDAFCENFKELIENCKELL